MSKFTPGPWKISHGCMPGDSGFSIACNNALTKNVKIVAECWPCTIVSEDHRRELFANAALIAAAPDLLAACKELAESAAYWSDYDVPLGIVDRLNDAIAKAEGGAT
jgi:hypothetical protein